jgi:hypothetical protein
MTERTNLILNFLKRIENCRNSRGFYHLIEIRKIRTSFFIYSENHLDLKRTLKQYYSNPNILTENSIIRWRAQRVIIKDVHNVISSSISFIDRIYKNKKDFPKTVENELILKIKQEPLYNLIRALRNYLIHIEPISLVSKKHHTIHTSGNIEIFQYESMNKDSFINYLKDRAKNDKNEWDKKALEYLKNLPDKINLNKLIQDFDILISSFHKWLIMIYTNENRAYLQDLKKEVTAIHYEASSKGFNKDLPITKAQLRHLNLLLTKSAKFYTGYTH